MKMHIKVYSFDNCKVIAKNYEYPIEIGKSDTRKDVLTEMANDIKKLNSASIYFALFNCGNDEVLFDTMLHLDEEQIKNFAFITLDYMDMFVLKAGEAKIARDIINRFHKKGV